VELIVDGHYVSAFTAWGDLDWSLCWPGYSDELTFDVASHPSIFKPGKIASLVWGGERMFTGTLDEPTRGQKLRAAGLHRLGEKFTALDGSSNLSLSPNAVLDAAIARGLPWVKPVPWEASNVALGTDSPSTVSQIIDAENAAYPGSDWGIFPDHSLRRFARTTPRLHVRPGGDGLGIAWDNYASTLIARYVDSTTHAYTTVIRDDATAEARWGYKEATVSTALNDGAEMTLAQAESVLDSMLAAGRSRPGWTQAIEVEYGAVLNDYQQPVDLATIRPYEAIRIHGLAEDVSDLAGQSWVDMPLARINHSGSTATLTPVGLVSPMGDVLSGKKP
jgi:hypothetical protein